MYYHDECTMNFLAMVSFYEFFRITSTKLLYNIYGRLFDLEAKLQRTQLHSIRKQWASRVFWAWRSFISSMWWLNFCLSAVIVNLALVSRYDLLQGCFIIVMFMELQTDHASLLLLFGHGTPLNHFVAA